MSSPTPRRVPLSARELYLLRQRAETFRVELELENQLRLKGTATLPPEWSTYLERERQMILDQIRIEEDLTSSSNLGMAHTYDSHPTHDASPIRGHASDNESIRGLRSSISPIRPEESLHSFILSENDGTLAFASMQCRP
jgi:hypothetical protein